MLRTFSFELLGSILNMYPSVFYNVSGLVLYMCLDVFFSLKQSLLLSGIKCGGFNGNLGLLFLSLNRFSLRREEWLDVDVAYFTVLCFFFDMGILGGLHEVHVVQCRAQDLRLLRVFCIFHNCFVILRHGS